MFSNQAYILLTSPAFFKVLYSKINYNFVLHYNYVDIYIYIYYGRNSVQKYVII